VLLDTTQLERALAKPFGKAGSTIRRAYDRDVYGDPEGALRLLQRSVMKQLNRLDEKIIRSATKGDINDAEKSALLQEKNRLRADVDALIAMLD
jgi:hypothetical protein